MNNVTSETVPNALHARVPTSIVAHDSDISFSASDYIFYTPVEHEMPEVPISATHGILKPVEFRQLSAHMFMSCGL